MNDVLKRFHDAAATWGPAIESAVSRLFWTLVVISMVWTFGMMALRKADIGEFFAEFVRFTIFTGFFWWLLTNANHGMNIAGTIVQSLQTLGAQAGGLSHSNLGPSSILDLGFELYNRTVQATSVLGWRQMATALVLELMALADKAVMGAAAGAAGGASALQAAFQKASASMETGGDMPSMGSVVNGGSGDEAGTGDTPFAQAAGFGGGDVGGGESSSVGGFAKAAKLATGTASELVKGVGSQMQQGFQERVGETTDGKLAASIRESMEPKEASQSGQFEGNSLGGDSGQDSKKVRS